MLYFLAIATASLIYIFLKTFAIEYAKQLAKEIFKDKRK